MNEEGSQSWHLSKSVPITLIGAILFQCGVFIWFASKQESRITHLETGLIEIQQDISSRAPTERETQNRLARLETAKEDISRRLDRIESKIDRILEKDG